MAAFLIILALVLFASLCIGYYFSNKVLLIGLKTDDEIREMVIDSQLVDLDWYESLTKESFTIMSPFGYRLAGTFIPAREESNKIMLIAHGVTVSQYFSIRYIKMFLDRGWNVFIYDHRRHGKSQGTNTTYGYYEKYDMKAVVDWIRKRFGQDIILGIHGESMGAAIALQYGGLVEDGADFYIADCPYSNFWEQAAYRLKVEHGLPPFPILWLVSLVIRMRAGFWLKDISPLEAVKRINHPVLFIHGADDDYIPPEMSKEMYSVKQGSKAIFIAPNAKHAEAYEKNQQEYERVIFDFISSHINLKTANKG